MKWGPKCSNIMQVCYFFKTFKTRTMHELNLCVGIVHGYFTTLYQVNHYDCSVMTK